MHSALPARKTSNPPPYASLSSRFPMLRRSRVRAIVLCVCALGVILFLFSRLFGHGSGVIPSGTPPVVIVTVVDPYSYSKEYIKNIKENRIEYARNHGKHVSSDRAMPSLVKNTDIRLTQDRLHNILHKHNRLRPQWIAKIVGTSSGSSSCNNQIPPQHLRVVF
jgi:hypothetical protein